MLFCTVGFQGQTDSNRNPFCFLFHRRHIIAAYFLEIFILILIDAFQHGGTSQRIRYRQPINHTHNNCLIRTLLRCAFQQGLQMIASMNVATELDLNQLKKAIEQAGEMTEEDKRVMEQWS